MALYRWEVGCYVFDRMQKYVIVRETVPFITVAKMDTLRSLNAECEGRIRKTPFLLLARDGAVEAVSLAGREAFDDSSHPVVDSPSCVDGDVIMVDWTSPLTVFEWHSEHHVLSSQGHIHSSTMCLPRRLWESDIAFLCRCREEHLQKQLAHGRLVLADGLVVSLYEGVAFNHLKTLVCSPH
jgi:hypothetical protein